ncbi:MAG: hypothetical protein ACE5GO_01610, partial [Anaerolineales bacterium]
PPVIQQAWGDEIVSEAVPWFEQIFKQIVAEKAVPRDEYREVFSRLDILEQDVRDLKTDVRELRTEMNERFDRMNDRFVEMERHIETRLDRMYRHSETRFDQVNARFDQVNARFDQMYQHFDARFDQMTERMMVQNRWLIGSLALFATIISILVAIGQFAP